MVDFKYEWKIYNTVLFVNPKMPAVVLKVRFMLEFFWSKYG
jgi:hypothetical protein